MHCTSCGQPILEGKGSCERCGTTAPSATVIPIFSRTDTTRLLCAACYLNPLFRFEVHENYIEARHNAIAPSYGVDLPIVVRHCLDARGRAFVRNLCVVGLLIVCSLVMLKSVPLAAVAFAVGLFAISFSWEWQMFNVVRSHLTRRHFDPATLGAAHQHRVAHLVGTGSGNLVVYSGFSPFVGSGIRLNTWNLAIDTRRGKCFAGARKQPRSFTMPELYEAIGKSIEGRGLHNCTIEDRIYVNGADVRDDTRFLEHQLARPFSSVERRIVDESLAQPSMRVRHYRCVRVVDWSGELVVSLFFRFAMCGHNLFMEASTHLLTPIDGLNRTIETVYTQISLLQILRRIAKAVLWCFVYFWWSPANVLYRLLHPLYKVVHDWFEDWLISEDPAFDYGTGESLREKACSSFLYRRYGQKLDGDMNQKVVEQTALDALVQFLEEHDIDTADLKEREATLLNNGVIMSGGQINAHSVSMGKGARSILGKVARTRKKAAAAGAAA